MIDDRPNALPTSAVNDELGAFYPYRSSDRRTSEKQFHDLGVADALAGAEFRETVPAFVREHGIASDRTAAREDRAFRDGPIYPGPLRDLSPTGRYARRYFPDELFDRTRVNAVASGGP